MGNSTCLLGFSSKHLSVKERVVFNPQRQRGNSKKSSNSGPTGFFIFISFGSQLNIPLVYLSCFRAVQKPLSGFELVRAQREKQRAKIYKKKHVRESFRSPDLFLNFSRAVFRFAPQLTERMEAASCSEDCQNIHSISTGLEWAAFHTQ